jgi:uncharacterized damage-inducible protein DinB
MPPEPWLRGPLPDVAPELMPAAHALLQTREDIERASAGLSVDEIWARPGGAASVGFHLRHVAGSIDRLLTYARGDALDAAQLAVLAREDATGTADEDAAVLVRAAVAAVDEALRVIRATPIRTLGDPRTVGRAALPSTLRGLLFHIAEHTQRHTGQIVTTAKIVRGLAASREGG